jgi:hypothetical protein
MMHSANQSSSARLPAWPHNHQKQVPGRGTMGLHQTPCGARHDDRCNLRNPPNPSTMLQHCPAHRLGKKPRKLPACPRLQWGTLWGDERAGSCMLQPVPITGRQEAGPGQRCVPPVAAAGRAPLASHRIRRLPSSALADAHSSTWGASKAHICVSRLPASWCPKAFQDGRVEARWRCS